MKILDVRNLKKQYRSNIAVNGISFSIEQGACFGLLGPNGAGKTTTMEVIEGITPPSEGTILYKGKPPGKSFNEEIGIQFQHTSLLNFLTVKETLKVYQKLFSISADLDELIKKCDLQPILARRNNQLSGGQRQRLMIALALVNHPELVFLDEPSTGLDPQSRRHLWEIISDINRAGKTVMMTTHSMEEAENLCDTVAIMDHGRIIARDSPAGLIATYCKTNSIMLPGNDIAPKLRDIGIGFISNGSSVTIQTDNVDETLSRLIADNINLRNMVVHSPNLEDVFLQLTGRKLRD